MEFWVSLPVPSHVSSYVYQVLMFYQNVVGWPQEKNGTACESKEVQENLSRHMRCVPRDIKKTLKFISHAGRRGSQKGVKFTRNWFGHLSLICKALRKWYKAKLLHHAREMGFSGQ